MRTVRLALVGLGTVGTGVVKLLCDERSRLGRAWGVDLDLSHVVVRDLSKERAVRLPSTTKLTNRVNDILADDSVSIVMELMGTVQPAFRVIESCLRAGKHVVTANKAVLSELGSELFAIAHSCDRTIAFEAAVCGAIPIVNVVGRSLAPNRITALAGILNGTSNYILSAMADRALSYEEALVESQQKGFAEADPELDVDGADAAQKLALLARLAFHAVVSPDSIARRGIRIVEKPDIGFVSELGYVIKLLAIAEVDGDRLYLRVGPTLVHKSHPLARVRGEDNAVQITGSASGPLFFEGKGAGQMPTASAVLSDVLELATGRSQSSFEAMRLWESDPDQLGIRFVPGRPMRNRFYLRFTIVDRPGTLAQIASILGRHRISIASVVQHETELSSGRIGESESAVPLVIMTHRASEAAVWDSLKETDALAIVTKPTLCLPVAE